MQETKTAEKQQKSNKSTLTKIQWSALEVLAETARESLNNLEFRLLRDAHLAGDDAETRDALLTEAVKIKSALETFLPAYFYHVQPEWTGGDSMDPRNTVYREPHIVKTRRIVA